jgi:uncharacterized protein YecT (DUF1311 family)
MLNVDLSALKGQELRQLLDTTRRRGEAALTYEILQEMEARRERGEPEGARGLFGPKRSTEPRVIDIDLGDPLDSKDPLDLKEPGLDEPSPAFAAWEEEPTDEATYLHPPQDYGREPEPPPAKPRRRALWLSIGLAIGLAVGLGVGGWAETVSRQSRAPPLALAAAAPRPGLAAAPPVADPIAVETETAPATPPPPAPIAAAPLAQAPAPEAAPPSPPTTELAENTTSASPLAADPAEAASKQAAASPTAAATGSRACAGQPTPADRTICGAPRLQQLQRDLRQAYAEALDAHPDRDLLREHQLAWRDARNTVAEPDRLAQLYEARIRKLNAATAEARRER